VDLGGKVRVLFSGIVDQGCARYVARARIAGRCSLRVRVRLADRLLDGREKKKKKFWNSRANWESLMRAGPTRLGAALDAGERSGPRWTGDAWGCAGLATLGSRGGGATRRLGVTGP
jgi:hypothetical protein